MDETVNISDAPELDYAKLKIELEIQKLKGEIDQLGNSNRELTNPWYKRPQWIMALSPIIIGLLTLLIAWASGFLQAQSTLNKIQEERFQQKKDSITKYLATLNYVSDSLTKSTRILKIQKSMLDSEFTSLKARYVDQANLLDTLRNTNFSKDEKINLLYAKNKSLQNALFLLQGKIRLFEINAKIQELSEKVIIESINQKDLLERIRKLLLNDSINNFIYKHNTQINIIDSVK
jgi:hypothetical protein